MRSPRGVSNVHALPDARRVLLIGVHNPFYLQREPVFSSRYDPPVAEWLVSGAATAEEIAGRVRRMGITHVVLNAQDYRKDQEAGLYTWSPETRHRFEEFLARDCKKLAQFGDSPVLQTSAP